jgi:hypothetical protein
MLAARIAMRASVSTCGGLSISTTSWASRNRSSSLANRHPDTFEKLIAATLARSARSAYHLVRLRCGSISTSATRWFAANQAARFAASVVFPAPPFCCATV